MKRVIGLYYIFQIGFSLLLWVPIFYAFQIEAGLTDAQFFQIQTVYYILFCLLEIPTGFVADRWGYRKSIILGAGALAVTNLLPVFWWGFLAFFVHFTLLALARSLISGAASAYLYEYLLGEDQAGRYRDIEGRAYSFSLLAKVVGWAGAGALMQWKFTSPYWMTAIASLVAVFAAWRLPEIARGPVAAGVQRLLRFEDALKQLVRTPVLLLLMVQGVGIFVLARVAQVNLYQPILESKGFGVVSYGVIMSAMTLVEAGGAYAPGKIQRTMSNLNTIFFLTIVIVLGLVVVALGGKIAAIVGFMMFALACGVAYPIQKQLLNESIADGQYRATLLSIESIIHRGVSAAVVSQTASYVAAGRIGHFLILASAGSFILVFLVHALLEWRKA